MPAEGDGFLMAIQIRSTPSFEVFGPMSTFYGTLKIPPEYEQRYFVR
jgi:hypothetical protein